MKEGVGRALRRAIGRDDILSRIKTREGGTSILMNEKRRTILQYLIEKPFMHLRELARETGIPVGTADWHLKILEQAKIISVFKNGNRYCYYPYGWIEEEDLQCLSALQDNTSRTIISLVMKEPGLSQTEIARKLGKYQQYVQPHIAQLQECDFLVSKREGRKKVYSIDDRLYELQDKYQDKMGSYWKGVLEVLQEDGLNPKIQGKSKVLMKVRMDDGQNVFFIRIRANPVKTILKG